MAKKKRNEPQTCAYCGQVTTDSTKDEPVPKCLFAPPRDGLISVPACKKCNNELKSRDDSYLRDMLALEREVSAHPDGMFIYETFLRASQKDMSVIARIVRKHGEFTYERDPETGLYLPVISVPLSRDRVRGVFKWIAQGLYYHDHGTVLDPTYRYLFKRISQSEAEAKEQFIASRGWKPNWTVGSRGQFRYFHIWFEDPNVTFWQMVFYERIFFVASSVPPNVNSLEEFDSRMAGLRDSDSTNSTASPPDASSSSN